MIPTLTELTALVADPARHGVIAMEALATDAVSLALVAEGRAPIERRLGGDARVAVRVFTADGRPGWASGPAHAVEATVAAARARAEAAAPVPEAGPQRRAEPVPRGLGIDDPRHAQITDEDRLEILTTNTRAAGRSPARAGPFTYREERVTRRLTTSTGLALEGHHTTYTASGTLTVDAPEGPVVLVEEVAGRAFASTACVPIGSNLSERARALSQAPLSLSGPVRVLLPPRATAPLIDWLARQLTPAALARGTVLSGALSEPILSRKLHLVDDGSAPGGLRTLGFDDRGTVPRPLTLVAEGRVVGRYLDLEAARVRADRPSGHAHDDTLRPSNLALNGGTRSMNAWLGEQTGLVLIVDALDGLDAQDPATGALDLVVNGVVQQGHAVKGAVRGLRLRGDLLTVLANVVTVTSDTDRLLHVDAPGLLLDGFTAG